MTERGRAGTCGEPTAAWVAGEQLQELRCHAGDHHRQVPRGLTVCQRLRWNRRLVLNIVRRILEALVYRLVKGLPRSMIVSELLTFITVGQRYKYLRQFIIVIPEECVAIRTNIQCSIIKSNSFIAFYISILNIFNIGGVVCRQCQGKHHLQQIYV